jgi:hypothetical protein
MSNYTQTTNFATKDALASGNPLKVVKGTEINVEFANIATAVATKSDLVSPTFTGTVTIPTLSYAGTTLTAAVTGTGKMVLDTSPTLVTPVLGVATATSINKLTLTAPATSATLTLANGASLITSGANSLTLTSTASTNVTLPTTGTLATLAGSETFTNKTLTTPNIDSASVPTVSGTTPLYFARVWVSFNGTGTVAIRGSGNVSSITDNGVGLYTVNFTTSMSDANYSTVLAGIGLLATNNSQGIPQLRNGSTPSTSAVSIQVGAHDSNQLLDSSYVQVAIFR